MSADRVWNIGGRDVRFTDDDMGVCPVDGCDNRVMLRWPSGKQRCGDVEANRLLHFSVAGETP